MATMNSKSKLEIIKKPFISITGLIGVGKSTLTKALAEKFEVQSFFEGEWERWKEMLADFYSDMKTHGFEFQIFLLNCRFKQHQKITWSGEGGVSDRSIYEDRIFASVLHEDGNLTDSQFKTYLDLQENMNHFLVSPTVIVHLEASPEECLKRIKKRGRACEEGITLEYLQKLHKKYIQFLEEISKSITVIRIDYSEFKEKEDEITRAEKVAEIVKNEYQNRKNIKDFKV